MPTQGDYRPVQVAPGFGTTRYELQGQTTRTRAMNKRIIAALVAIVILAAGCGAADNADSQTAQQIEDLSLIHIS